MCGIAGVITDAPTMPRPAFQLAHRGPNGEATAELGDGSWSGHLYHSRLAINDLTDAGQEPMMSRCGSGLILCFNGEIYNSPDLRRECEARGHRFKSDMDGEVILHLYEDYGPSALERLNGIFAFSIIDGSGNLVLARDAIGVKPLFYRVLEHGIAFASEPDQLRQEFGDTSWDVRALASFLTFLWVPAPWTAFQEIRALRPGEMLEWRPGSTRPEVGFGPHALTLAEELEPPAEPAESGRQIGDLLDHAVRRQLLSDVPIGVMASGGTDSTLIWNESRDVARVGYTIHETAGVEGLHADAEAAARYTSDYGLRHRLLEPGGDVLDDIPETGDLIADPAFSLARTISAEARRDGVLVLLSGQGADEVLGGYRRHSAAMALDRAPSSLIDLAARAAKRSAHPIRAEYGRRLHAAARATDPFERYSHLYRYADSETRARILDVTESEVSDNEVFSEHRRTWEALPDGWSLTKRAVTLDLQVYLPGLGLTYVDRASMDQGVEVRVPWLDRDIVAWSLLQSPETFVGLRHRKLPARWLSARRVPDYVWNRPKVGFAVAAERLGVHNKDAAATQRHHGYIRRCIDVLEALGVGLPS